MAKWNNTVFKGGSAMFRVRLLSIVGAVAGLLFLATGFASAGTLFVGADVEDFAGGYPSPGLDRLGVVTTGGLDGTSVITSTIIGTDFLINGMADADGKLLAGTPLANPLNTVAFDGTLISSITASGIPNGSCCNEEMLFVPQAGGGSKFYHAKYGAVGGIREIDPVTGNLIAYDPLTDVVGMALVNGEIWITRWANREIGIWNPLTKVFTVQFDLDLVGLGGLGNAGALAFDPGNQVLWLGTQSGRITPLSLTGAQLGPSYFPFGSMPETIDGLTFLGEVTGRIPEPAALAIFAFGLAGLGFMRRRCVA